MFWLELGFYYYYLEGTDCSVLRHNRIRWRVIDGRPNINYHYVTNRKWIFIYSYRSVLIEMIWIHKKILNVYLRSFMHKFLHNFIHYSVIYFDRLYSKLKIELRVYMCVWEGGYSFDTTKILLKQIKKNFVLK